MDATKSCIFCEIIQKRIPATFVHETDSLIVIKDINPSAPIHFLIIPKKHVVDISSMSEQDLALGRDIYACAQELSRTYGDFKLIVNNGYKAGQRVFHLHAHFLGGLNEE